MEEEMYQLAISMPLDRKIEKAIAALKHYEQTVKTWDMFEPWDHLCMSYGKDSVVIEWLARQAGVAYKCYHSHTTLDAPELIRFGRQHYPATIVSYPAKPMLAKMIESASLGPPTRMIRWCCESYKEQGCKGQIKIFGIRAEESNRRKQNWRLWTPHRSDESWILNPILYWTNEDVWTLIHRENIPYCSLYDEGFKRLGCIGCPMAPRGRFREFERWPKYEKAWKRAFERFWKKWHNSPLLRERWVSCEGKYRFQPLANERIASRFVKKTARTEEGFWTLRRWYDLKGYEKWEDLWAWWMEDEEESDGCTMGQF